MHKVYSCENILALGPYKFALEAAGIKYLIKNEYNHGAMGELPLNESWPQIWVLNNSDKESAANICQKVEKEQQNVDLDWLCSFCNEQNASSFELCWQCQALKP